MIVGSIRTLKINLILFFQFSAGVPFGWFLKEEKILLLQSSEHPKDFLFLPKMGALLIIFPFG